MSSKIKYRTALLRCARLLSDELNHVLIPFQLNYSLWQVIYVLNEKTECTSIELAQYLNVSKPSITKRIQVLEQLNVIEHVHTEDKRQKMLRLNTEGLQLYQQCSATIDDYESGLLQDINTHDLDVSLQTLTELMKILENTSVGAQS
ncbi:MarR family transcriptional regulator [Acinetobacter sp. 194]|uniref:MarR family winged helix-turn-helix transcriptional regulator n=1 Tax=Acinetobacter shaoyimingii TaxID=2715164 RepID=UPI001408D1C0|nr:MarR family transcriptional regulator [Acinetobacter shaoyimingii]NHB57461.1 MarR family transcriptional regulator [Acinetobacter shaoyimingii]